ncbi:hypothetical protein C8R43DRAFT_941015 [Mycena crocata]|nr:hypothetical protein C8R43DRAFT_941015 [Mycena crocata]
MPKATKIQQYSDVLFIAENLLAASVALEEDVDDLDGFEEDEAELFCDDISEILDLTSLDWLEIAEFMLGDGSRGRYDQIPKSVDFFSVCLQAPDREFRHMFRIGRNMFDWLVATLSTNPIFMSRGRKPQRHAKYQLGCFLVRYGAIGSDALGTAQKLSIGFGSVFLYCRRTTR